MPKPFTASYNGVCARCGNAIEAGVHNIVQGTRAGSTGRYFHVSPSCEEIRVKASLGLTTTPVAAVAQPVVAVAQPVTVAPVVVAPEADPRTPAAIAAIAKSVATGIASTMKVTSKSEWWEVAEVLLQVGCRRIGLFGPAGTGKSTLAEFLFADASRPTQRITLAEDTDRSELLGTWVLRNGQTTFQYGPAIVAMQNGWRLQLDEIRHCSDEVMSLLFALMDDNPQVTTPDGVCHKAAAGYTVVVTDNESPATLPDPIQNRLEAKLLAIKPHASALADLSKGEAAVVQNYYSKLAPTPWQFRDNPTLRGMKSFSRLNKTGRFSDEVLAKAVFGESGPEILAALQTAGR